MFWRKREDQTAENAPVQELEQAQDAKPPAGDASAVAVAEPEADEVAIEKPAPGVPETDAGRDPNIGLAQLEGRIIAAISEVYDPEIPVNIYEMGLIYDLDITADHCVRVQMTLTSPACPVAGSLPGEVEAKIREVDGVNDVALELVWDPPWTPDRMSEAAKLELGFM